MMLTTSDSRWGLCGVHCTIVFNFQCRFVNVQNNEKMHKTEHHEGGKIQDLDTKYVSVIITSFRVKKCLIL